MTRSYVLGHAVERRYVGYVNWNGLVPASDDLAPKNSWNVYVGEHKRASMMPVGGDRFTFDVPLPKGTVSKPDYREELALLQRLGSSCSNIDSTPRCSRRIGLKFTTSNPYKLWYAVVLLEMPHTALP